MDLLFRNLLTQYRIPSSKLSLHPETAPNYPSQRHESHLRQVRLQQKYQEAYSLWSFPFRRRVLPTLVHRTRNRSDTGLPQTLAMPKATGTTPSNCSGMGSIRHWHRQVLSYRCINEFTAPGVQVAQVTSPVPSLHQRLHRGGQRYSPTTPTHP
jgi:hypothetical protein